MDILPFDVLKLKTTPLGEERIRRNLDIPNKDIEIIKFMRDMILDDNATIERRGKNWYITFGGCVITVNASSLTIITAHRKC